MSIELAARVGDPIGHTPLLGMICKVGAGLLAGLAVGAAVGAAAVAIVGTGGFGAVVLGAVVGSVIGMAADGATNLLTGSDNGLIGFLTDKACAAVDAIFPKDVTGAIITGSPNVYINNRNAAITLTSKVSCGKHSPPPEAAEGSSTVHINNELCHRKNDKVCCGGVTLQGSPNVHVGQSPQAQCEIQDEMPWYLQAASKYLGMAISLCTSRGKGIFKKLLCIGKGFVISAGADAVVRGAANMVKNAIGGNPVLAVTGTKFLDDDTDTDFGIPSRLPIVWQRRYNSLDTRKDGLLGQGWTTPYGVQLKLHQEGEDPTVYIDEKGREIFFPALSPGESAWNGTALCRLACLHSGQYILEGEDGLYRDFGKPVSAGPHTLNLERLEDRNANWISLYFSDDGVLERMADSAGNLLRFTPDASFSDRVSKIEVCATSHDAAAWRTLVEYTYDDAGRLALVTDATGHTVRRFSYHDQGPGAGLMASHTLPSGLSCRYEWALFDHPRVVRTAHTDGQWWKVDYDIENGITRSVDFMDRKETWTWDADFNLLSHTDALGQIRRVTWNDNNQPISFTGPNNATWTYEYDDNGLLTKIISPLGGVSETCWDPILLQPLSESDPAGNTIQYAYDKLGNLIRLVDPAGQETAYGLDACGQVSAITDPQDNIIRLVWGDDGQLIRHVDCSGNETAYAYDAKGDLLAITDAEGHTTRYTHDLLGRVTQFTAPDGGTGHIERDAAGRPVAFTDALGHTSRYAYTLRDQPALYVNALGHRQTYSYSIAGNLITLRNENQEAYAFAHDALDRQISQTGLDDVQTRWTLDSNDLPVEVCEAAGTAHEQRTVFERDIIGRLTRKITAETLTDYTYDPLSRVTKIVRTDLSGTEIDRIEFAYDVLGNLTEEKTTTDQTRVLKHRYDHLGNRVQTLLPDGRVLNFTFCGSGYLHQIATAETALSPETVISALERDRLQRE
ncbi:DUF6531 domain-containing protein, partial [Desulfosarcina sp. OttesenSCG-928-G10]|nr:DUF6531 domain-containing protein [Desulfosarcina sp. OttesenSCG-928-G10]